jgi:Pyruvate:ferredoxin oxidoreductase and related 2-oxoacid:ferredoxin oxidoreductases, beta subunit
MASQEKYLRPSGKPHFWCPGCGNGIALGALLRAIDKVGFEQRDTVIVSGIGCSSHGPSFVKFHTVNSLHGRPLPFATGIKFADPDLHVIVFTGDGDTTAIGANHFIQTCRRNIDITMVVINNNIYGMTGGQYSPMTPTDAKSTTSVYGHIERPFSIPELASAAGATYVARGTTYHTRMLEDLIADGLESHGFSVIETISACPTNFGRRNNMRSAVDMMNWQRDHAVMMNKAADMTKEEMADKFIIGKFKDQQAPEYTDVFRALSDRLTEKEAQ